MEKKLYTAIATVRHTGPEWNVVIGNYESLKDAEEAIDRFKRRYEGTHVKVVKTEIRKPG